MRTCHACLRAAVAGRLSATMHGMPSITNGWLNLNRSPPHQPTAWLAPRRAACPRCTRRRPAKTWAMRTPWLRPTSPNLAEERPRQTRGSSLRDSQLPPMGWETKRHLGADPPRGRGSRLMQTNTRAFTNVTWMTQLDETCTYITNL